MTKSSEIIEDWINTVQLSGRDLSKWEQDFMESIQDQFERKKWISDKQEEILERIYSEKTP